METKLTIKRVAELAGVSTATVSAYLNDRQGLSQATREKIAAIINENGYVPRSNSKRRVPTKYIGMIVEQLPLPLYSDYFYAKMAQAINEEAEKLGYSLVLGVLDATQKGLPRIVNDAQISGLIAIGGGDITDELLSRIAGEGKPTIAVDNYSRTCPVNAVLTDNLGGGYMITRHLISLGHRRIAILLGADKYKPLVERYLGYQQAMIEAGLPIEPDLVQPYLSKGFPNKGYREMHELLKMEKLPTAVFAISDRAALGALDAVRERGLRVPDDISLAGFDDIVLSSHSIPPLTTVHPNQEAIGRTAVQWLHSMIHGETTTPMKKVLYTELVVRESTAAPRGTE